MTDNWFIQDIENQLQLRNRAVILDPAGQCEFLLPLLNGIGVVVLKTDSTKTEEWQTIQEELLLRHEAEGTYAKERVVFYVTRDVTKLSFLYDYCFTHGCLDLSKPGEWLKKKLFANTGLQVKMDNPLLLTAAKLGLEKDLSWWKKILQNLEELVSIEDELLPFLNSPENYFSTKDADVKRLFEEKLFDFLGQPYMVKPPATLANEVANLIFDKLLHNSIDSELLEIYYKWIDSHTYKECMSNYLSNYKVDPSVNIWGVHPDHCFISIDKASLVQICENIRDASFVKEKLSKLKKRASSTKAINQVPSWWKDVFELLEFDNRNLSSCNEFNKVVDYYTSNFHKVDRAIRNLYSNFLQDENIIRPLQEYYENLNHEVLQHWFDYRNEYMTNQQGYLIELIKNSKPGIAVIVGDGVRYEIASFVASVIEKQHKVERHVMLADMPSETEHNMSALYVGENKVIPIHKDREVQLSAITGKEINYINLEALHYGVNSDYLVLTYKDIDSAGEKLQQGAIKLFDEFEKVLIEKITLLLNMGYREVHLVTDHGFVLTGLLDESDKIENNATGKKEVHERFIRTEAKQTNPDWISFDVSYNDFKFVYAAKSHRPFKSKGVYGFSHGGFTPQEIIIPNFVFSKAKSNNNQLDVFISNKNELSEVPSELFIVRLDSPKEPTDLFGGIRKVQIKIFSNNEENQVSDILTIEKNSITDREFSFNGNKQVQAVLIDANTKEKIDSVIIKKANFRDLGGL